MAHDLLSCEGRSPPRFVTMDDLYERDITPLQGWDSFVSADELHELGCQEVLWPTDRLVTVLQHLRPDNLHDLVASCNEWPVDIRDNFHQACAPWRRWSSCRKTWVQAVVAAFS